MSAVLHKRGQMYICVWKKQVQNNTVSWTKFLFDQNGDDFADDNFKIIFS